MTAFLDYVKIKERVDIFASLVKDGMTLPTETVLRILGTPKCIEVADYINEDHNMCEKFLKREEERYDA